MRWSVNGDPTHTPSTPGDSTISRAATRVLWLTLTRLRSFVSRHNRTAGYVEHGLRRLPALQDAIQRLARREARGRYERWIAAYDALGEADVAAMNEQLASLAEPRVFSLIVPLVDGSGMDLDALGDSLLSQVYERWEMRVVTSLPTTEHVGASVTRLSDRDSRFRAPSESADSLVDALNSALGTGSTDYAVIADPRVLLRPHAFFLLATAIEGSPDAVLLYGDEDMVDESGARFGHYFKPAGNPALLRSQNYFGDFVCIRRSRAMAVGGFRHQLDGDFVWDLCLRLTEGASPDEIHHLPYVLSSRSDERGRPSEERRHELARALEGRLASIGEPGQVEPAGRMSYRTRYALPDDPPLVSIIVPTTCPLDFLRPCMDGILGRTTYPNLEVLLVVNALREETREQREYLDEITESPQVRSLFLEERPFNFSRTNNWAAEQAHGELFCFVNDDTEVITPDWLSTMTGHVLRDRVAAVGALLLYPNDRIQHAGVVLGAGGVAAHSYKSMPRGTHGYHDRAVVDQDVSCVSAACALVRREAFSAVGGFDETLPLAFNDVDLCLRLQEAGWRIVWTPGAQLYHKESASLGPHYVAEDRDQWQSEWNRVRSRWDEKLRCDSHYNPNLSLDVLQLWEPAFPPRVSYPWRQQSAERPTDAEIAL